MDEFFTMELNSEESEDLCGLNLPFNPLRSACQPPQLDPQVQSSKSIQNPPTNPPIKASTTIASGWRYDFSIFVNKQREATDFGYVSKSPNFHSFEIFEDKLLDNTVRILPAVLSSKTHNYPGLSGTIVAMAPKEIIGATDLDEASWTKIDHEICHLVDQKPKRNLTLSIRVDYVTISSVGLGRSGQGQYGGSGITSLGSKGNKKLRHTIAIESSFEHPSHSKGKNHERDSGSHPEEFCRLVEELSVFKDEEPDNDVGTFSVRESATTPTEPRRP
ncbi:hypothetical protein HOY82DRAFT_646223 [Tuber indicum]|nr:hypothetical protein HOY82DRAFT_646223 [Tuber indicum]